MPHYFYPLDASFFHGTIRPALGQCWRRRSFAPCLDLCRQLQSQVTAFLEGCPGETATVFQQVTAAMPFDRAIWRCLVGEVLLFAAQDWPTVQVPAKTWSHLLAAESDPPRDRFAPIHQGLWGKHDLVFAGGYYRPFEAGWNDVEDVVRLTDFLRRIQPGEWKAEQLAGLEGMAEEEERQEELDFSRQIWPQLVQVYEKAAREGWVIACEAE